MRELELQILMWKCQHPGDDNCAGLVHGVLTGSSKSGEIAKQIADLSEGKLCFFQ